MSDGLGKALWFVGLWMAGVGTVTMIGILIRSVLL